MSTCVQYFKPGAEPAEVSIQAPSPVPGIYIEIEAVAVAKGEI